MAKAYIRLAEIEINIPDSVINASQNKNDAALMVALERALYVLKGEQKDQLRIDLIESVVKADSVIRKFEGKS
jgi:hypothetical protein